MYKLIIVIICSMILLYSLLKLILNFIGKNDSKINDSRKARIFVAVIFGLAMGLLYVKYFLSIHFFLRYYILMLYLTIVGYIDYYTRKVYNFLSYVFLGIGLIFLVFSLINGESILKYLILVTISILISSIFSIFKLLGWGDVETFTVAAIYIGNFIAAVNIFLSFSLAGVGSIIKIFMGKAKLRDRGTLCPYIAISTYLVIVFML